jgi:hypothetical protein
MIRWKLESRALTLLLLKRLEPQSIFLLLLDGGSSLQTRDLTLLLLKRLEPQSLFLLL